MTTRARLAPLAIILALCSILGIGSCSSHEQPPAASDAAAPAKPQSTAEGATLTQAIRLASSTPELTRRLLPDEDGWQQTADGVTSPGWRSSLNQRAYHVGARLPATASEAFEAGLGISELYRLTLTARGAADSALSLQGGKAVYQDAFRDTDVIFAADPARVEWMYLLRTREAPRLFELGVRMGKNLRGRGSRRTVRRRSRTKAARIG